MGLVGVTRRGERRMRPIVTSCATSVPMLIPPPPHDLVPMQRDNQLPAGHELFLRRISSTFNGFIEEVGSTEPLNFKGRGLLNLKGRGLVIPSDGCLRSHARLDPPSDEYFPVHAPT